MARQPRKKKPRDDFRRGFALGRPHRRVLVPEMGRTVTVCGLTVDEVAMAVNAFTITDGPAELKAQVMQVLLLKLGLTAPSLDSLTDAQAFWQAAEHSRNRLVETIFDLSGPFIGGRGEGHAFSALNTTIQLVISALSDESQAHQVCASPRDAGRIVNGSNSRPGSVGRAH